MQLLYCFAESWHLANTSTIKKKSGENDKGTEELVQNIAVSNAEVAFWLISNNEKVYSKS